jgi:hypothetical protein
MKKILFILITLLLATTLHAADVAISELPEDTSPTLDDLILTVNSPASSPSTQKATIANAVGDISTDLGLLAK